MDVTVTTVGFAQAVVGIAGVPAKLEAGVNTAVTVNGTRLLTAVKARVSGRPGPRAITGDYRRSWTKSTSSSTLSKGKSVVVGTNAPQGRRLEYGFVGKDRLGRDYNQPPYPHAGPAFAAVQPLFLADVAAAMKAATAL